MKATRGTTGRRRRHATLVVVAAVAVLAAALVTTAGASHSMDRDTLEEHCPDHQGHPNKVEDPEPGSTREVDVDGTTVVLVFSEDGRSVEFQDENGDPIAVDFCLKAGDRAGGEETGTEGHVSWTNRGGQIPQISYVIVYRIADGDPCEGAGGDTDGDGVCDDDDNCPEVANPDQEDSDGDGIGDACDTEGPPGDESCSDGVDNDGDGLIDEEDPDCQEGDPCDGAGGDTDGDGVCDDDDNCPEVANPDQEDSDGDGIGDACDTEGPPGDPSCSDGVDNDGDGLIDGDDPDCQGPPDGLTCRANLLAAALAGNALPNLFEANPPSDPCVAEQDGLLVALSPLLGDGGLGVLNDENQIELADPSGTQPGFIIVDALWADTDTDGSTASADSGVLLLHVNDGTDDQIIVEVLTSESQTSCDTGTTTSAEVVRLFLGGEEVRIPGEHTVLIDPALFEVIELHLEDAGDGADEGPDATGAQAADLAALAGNLTAAVADSETGCG